MTNSARAQAPLVGKAPTAEELYLLQWGQDALKDNLKIINDILRQQVTLVATLVTAVTALRAAKVLPATLSAVVITALIVALVAALVGALPFQSKVNLNDPAAIRKHKERAYGFKRIAFGVSAILLLVALGAAGVGVLV